MPEARRRAVEQGDTKKARQALPLGVEIQKVAVGYGEEIGERDDWPTVEARQRVADLATLRQELATAIKELKGEGVDLGQRVDTVERSWDIQEEELDHHSQEIITLQESNRDLQYRLEDLDNRSRHSNICIMGVPAQVTAGTLEDFEIRLF
ncbi:hypothetical protein NDU88_011957 [Pleurodeles waltl]|uniref:Uncharacterized protein n=1 Tax=Pleurodeles waltl TaxID=8319 RepID=A0AAV7QYT3_PLEWA|nr:hypothetical protein NDU88_011957 [Pleurodeles waltl]